MFQLSVVQRTGMYCMGKLWFCLTTQFAILTESSHSEHTEKGIPLQYNTSETVYFYDNVDE